MKTNTCLYTVLSSDMQRCVHILVKQYRYTHIGRCRFNMRIYMMMMMMMEVEQYLPSSFISDILLLLPIPRYHDKNQSIYTDSVGLVKTGNNLYTATRDGYIHK